MGGPGKEWSYLEFYNFFRSPEPELKKRQEIFLGYFTGCRNVLDIGCGRGEFLELLRENGINAMGIDIDDDMVEHCRDKGLNVDKADAVSYLRNAGDDTFDGIFMDQLIEHLEPGYMIRMIKLCYAKMKNGHYIIAKTINPLSLVTFTDYYLDSTHTMPVHPEALKFIMGSSGFRDIEIKYISRVPENKKLNYIEIIPDYDDNMRKLIDTYNNNIDKLNNILFGSEDYAAIGHK